MVVLYWGVGTPKGQLPCSLGEASECLSDSLISRGFLGRCGPAGCRVSSHGSWWSQGWPFPWSRYFLALEAVRRPPRELCPRGLWTHADGGGSKRDSLCQGVGTEMGEDTKQEKRARILTSEGTTIRFAVWVTKAAVASWLAHLFAEMVCRHPYFPIMFTTKLINWGNWNIQLSSLEFDPAVRMWRGSLRYVSNKW